MISTIWSQIFLYRHVRRGKSGNRRHQLQSGQPRNDRQHDWVIEIVSPSSRPMDYYKKLFKYRTAKVREYWVVDPDRKIVTVYNFEKDIMEEYSFTEEVPVGIYEEFTIRIE